MNNAPRDWKKGQHVIALIDAYTFVDGISVRSVKRGDKFELSEDVKHNGDDFIATVYSTRTGDFTRAPAGYFRGIAAEESRREFRVILHRHIGDAVVTAYKDPDRAMAHYMDYIAQGFIASITNKED